MIITRGLGGGLMVTQGYGVATVALVYPYCPSPKVYQSSNLYVVDELLPYRAESSYYDVASLFTKLPSQYEGVDQYTLPEGNIEYTFMDVDNFVFMDNTDFEFGGQGGEYAELESQYEKSDLYTSSIPSLYSTEAYPCDPVEVPIEEFDYQFMDGTDFNFMDDINYEFTGGGDLDTYQFMDGIEYTFMDGTAYDFK